jgi:hypothetical protein
MNFPSGLTFEVPANLLNLSGENTLEILIHSREKPDQGIPDMVRVFAPTDFLGLSGIVYLIWNAPSRFSDFRYHYNDGKLSYTYQLVLPEEELSSGWPQAKIRCDEEVVDPEGRSIFKRFEYIDKATAGLSFTRTVDVQTPQLWPDAEKWRYRIRLTARSDTGFLARHEQILGLRQIEVQNGEIQINQEKILIKGCTYRLNYPVYDENLPVSADQNFFTQVRADMADIKQLGFNAIRLPNTIANPYFFNLADSLGIFLFVENGFWRVPEPYFRDDRLLQAAKTIADITIRDFAGHPSLTAFGLGTEIPVHQPSVEKFILILKGYIKQNSALPLYLIPLNYRLLKDRPVTDFYIFNKYDVSLLSDFATLTKNAGQYSGNKVYLGNVGFSLKPEAEDKAEYVQVSLMQRFFEKLANSADIRGYFIESYRDWPADIPARDELVSEQGRRVYPYGLLGTQNEKRQLYYLMPAFLSQEIPAAKATARQVQKSNFFSIIVFILSVLFFYIYRRDYRFRENLKRSLGHPFGFFVDLRDRRIISIIDSSLIGMYTNFLVAVTISAYLYYMRDNLLLEEYLSAFLVPLGLKQFYLLVIESPYKITFFIWFLFYFLQLIVVIVLKMFNLLAEEKIRFRQYMAVCNWAGASLLFLLPVSLLSFHLMRYEIYHWLAVLILVIFFLWFNFRLGNGLRVLLNISAIKIFVLILLTYSAVVFTFGAIFESKYGLLTYFRLLVDANPLF